MRLSAPQLYSSAVDVEPGQLLGVRTISARRRNLAAASALIAGSALWCISVGWVSVPADAYPWYLSIIAIGGWGAQQAIRRAFGNRLFVGEWAAEPLSLLETWSLSFLIVSLAFSLLALEKLAAQFAQQQKPVQFIEIELSSTSDFADRRSPLPGTQKQELLHRRQSDPVDSQGQVDAQRRTLATTPHADKTARQLAASGATVRPMRQRPAPHESTETRLHSQPKPTGKHDDSSSQTDMVLIKPEPVNADNRTAAPKIANAPQQNTAPYFEEVKPPEMVEMMDNDGSQDSHSIFLAGGNSVGGAGAVNDLSIYLKELHKRIKSKWAPPRGQPHYAYLLFRVRADGRLVFIKVTHSSGNATTDEAAARAIIEAANGYRLPAASKLPYLDIEYRFNYLLDELKEVSR